MQGLKLNNLTTWEAEIRRRIINRGQPRKKKIVKIPSQPTARRDSVSSQLCGIILQANLDIE
jgi:hypothetical protein